MNSEFNEYEGEGDKGLKLRVCVFSVAIDSPSLMTLLRTSVLSPLELSCAEPVYCDLLWIF